MNRAGRYARQASNTGERWRSSHASYAASVCFNRASSLPQKGIGELYHPETIGYGR